LRISEKPSGGGVGDAGVAVAERRRDVRRTLSHRMGAMVGGRRGGVEVLDGGLARDDKNLNYGWMRVEDLG
jgi:hypothetical protein